MLDDILSKKTLAEMIGAARFNTPEEFQTLIKPKLLEGLSIDEDRLNDKAQAEAARHDLHILDSLTKREVILVIGLKTLAQTPQISADDIAKFHETVQALKAPYGVLTTETETHFYKYTYKKEKGKETSEVAEIEKLDPLNYIDAEFGDQMSPQKLKDLVLAHRNIAIAVILVIVLIIAGQLARASLCKSNGDIKAEVNSQGELIYFTPDQSAYANRTTGDVPGERRFCNEQEAVDAGWVKSQ